MSNPHINFSARYPKDHPIWRLLMHGMYMGFATLFLWLNASNFDSTEFKTLGELLVALGGVELVKKKFGV